MFARAIYILLGIIAIGLLVYSHFQEEGNAALYAVAFFVPAVAVYVLAPQINWWYYERNPPKLDPALKKLLAQQVPFYRALNEEQKAKFEHRLFLFMEGKDFTPIKLEKVGEDIKAAIAISGVMLTFNKEENWLIENYEKIIIYPHPFPSPQYEAWHITEHYKEDGVLMFTAQHVMHGFFQSKKYLNIALYEWANVYLEDNNLPMGLRFSENSYADFEKITGWSEETIKNYVGLKNLNTAALAITFFFTHTDKMHLHLPKAFDKFQQAFVR